MTWDEKGTPVNGTSTPKSIEPRDALVAGADERLEHAHEQITRAGEQLARLDEQVAKMERDAARRPSTGPGPQSPPTAPGTQSRPTVLGSQSPPRRPVIGARVGLALAACIIVAALVLQSSYGG